VLKRVIDIVGASVLLAITAPLFLIAAVAVKIDSPGPVFFGQWRAGQDMRLFRIWKFRSMRVRAEDERDELVDRYDVTRPLFKLSDDPRMTRVGRVLRQWSLDELPQLWNVVRGDMSLVGPRPPLPEEVRADGLRQRLRLQMRPGVTGPWQVNGRCELPYREGVSFDLAYIRNWSIAKDIAILARTPWAVLTRKGAY
jgi:lipopolysaccharide/colanic/teichoic acid biosynthesis glycosyltransferase